MLNQPVELDVSSSEYNLVADAAFQRKDVVDSDLIVIGQFYQLQLDAQSHAGSLKHSCSAQVTGRPVPTESPPPSLYHALLLRSG
jgi:hypothetical protein